MRLPVCPREELDVRSVDVLRPQLIDDGFPFIGPGQLVELEF